MDGPTIATLILAAFTALLVFGTFRLATQAGEDTRAQWRPVLLLRERLPEDEMRIDGSRLIVLIENVGRGPALEVSGFLRNRGTETLIEDVSALPPGDRMSLEIDLPEDIGDVVGGRLQYTDISRAGCATVFLIGISTPQPVLLYQSFEAHRPLRFWWEPLVPRRLRKFARPLWRRAVRRRGYEIP